MVRGGDGDDCVYLQAPTSDVPLPPGQWGAGAWSSHADPVGDVRTADGAGHRFPDIDITNVWWRTGPLNRRLTQRLGDDAILPSQGARPRTGTDYLQVVLGVGGDTLGVHAAEETHLFGIVTDSDGVPGNDWPARVDQPFFYWTGGDTIHQGGQFDTGDLGAGGTQLDAEGTFTGHYNLSSDMALIPVRDQHSYVLLLPTDQVGDVFRPFSQGVVDEVQVYDIGGDTQFSWLPTDAATFSAPPGCVEALVAPPPKGSAEGTTAAFQVRIDGFDLPDDPTARIDLEASFGGDDPLQVLLRGEPVDLGDGRTGWTFSHPLTESGNQIVQPGDLIHDADQDGIDDGDLRDILRDPRVWQVFVPMQLTGGRFGHLAGARGCARPPEWSAWSDACDPIEKSAGSVAAALEEAGFAIKRDDDGDPDLRFQRGGDEDFRTCAVLGTEGAFLVGYVVSRFTLTVAEAVANFAGLEREGCTVTHEAQPPLLASAVRTCPDPESTTVSALVGAGPDATKGRGVLVQVSRYVDPLDELAALATLVSLAVRTSDQDGDGIPDEQDDDVDGDGIPNDADPDDDNDRVPDAQDRWPTYQVQS
jgi:hypothetical protein